MNVAVNSRGENDADRLRGLLAHDALSVDLVSGFAGDHPLTEADQSSLFKRRKDRGLLFYSDLLYAITHQYFSPEAAQVLWKTILAHKLLMAKAMGRNVTIVVSALDTLANLDSHVRLPTLVNEAQIAEIVSSSMRDGLTGLFNHTSCHEFLDHELSVHARSGGGLSFIFADIDSFKEINDMFGHQEGDRSLAAIAEVIKKGTRDSDICCRYGGDEFAIILPQTQGPRALQIAERIRMDSMTISVGGKAISLSFGVAVCGTETQTAHALVQRADQALIDAKRTGKNKVVLL